MLFEKVSILRKKNFEQYRYFTNFVRTCIDTSKSEFEQVSILQKLSSFTALVYIDYNKHSQLDLVIL